MNSFLDQLNLTPQERRMLLGIAVVVFIVLNWLFVWSHFSDLSRVRRELAGTRDTIQQWNKTIRDDVDPSNGYKKKLQQLERQQGGGIVNQQVQLQRSISDQGLKTGVNISEIKPATSPHPDTNKFYVEQSVHIIFESDEGQLVNFLYNVGNDPAMIRVRELNLRTADANRYRLKGDAILTANYAKQPPAAPKAGATNAPAGAGPAHAHPRPPFNRARPGPPIPK